MNFKPLHYRAKSAGDGEESSFLWNVRKQCATVVDTMASTLPPDLVLELMLPVISTFLASSDIWLAEAGMLSLGALSNGCYEEMCEHLPQILPVMLTCLNHEGNANPPELKAVCCWVMKRYVEFWLRDNDDVTDSSIQNQVLNSLLRATLDIHPVVQCAACSAICEFIENVDISGGGTEVSTSHSSVLHTNLENILMHFQKGLQVYGIRSSIALFDALAALCEALGPLSLESNTLQSSSLVSIPPNALSNYFLPAIMEKFFSTVDNHFYLFPLMECITSSSVAVGIDIAPYAVTLVRRCLVMIGNINSAYSEIEMRALSAQQGSNQQFDELREPPSKDFIVCSLDVMGCVAVALRENFASLVLGRYSDGNNISG